MRPLTSSSHFEFFIGSGSFAMLNAIVRASGFYGRFLSVDVDNGVASSIPHDISAGDFVRVPRSREAAIHGTPSQAQVHVLLTLVCRWPYGCDAPHKMHEYLFKDASR